MPYTNNFQVANFLQRDLTENEIAYLVILIPAIQTWIDKRLNSTFDQVDPSVRTYDGGVRNLDIDPCTNITQIEAINDDGTDSYVYTQPYEIVVEPQNETVKREVRKRLAAFPRGISRISVSAQFSEYDNGVAPDITLLATRLVAGVINQGKFHGSGGTIMQESLEGHEVRNLPTAADILGIVTSDPTVAAILQQRQELYVDNYDPRNELGSDDDDNGGLMI